MSKKNKIGSNKAGNKVKREDDEEDTQIMEDKMSVMASLGGKEFKSRSRVFFSLKFYHFEQIQAFFLV